MSILFVLMLINVIATISANDLFQQLTKPLFVPVFLIYFLLRNKQIKISILAFLLFSFIGDFTSVFTYNLMLVNISSLAYCLSYSFLIIAVATRIKKLELDKVISSYLVFVFLINAYLLYTLFDVIKYYIPDSIEVSLFGIKSATLIALAFVSFVDYLNSETKVSIQFLIMVLCFVFSDVLNYISTYYLYNSSFVMLDRVLHLLGLFFLFSYVLERNKAKKELNVKAAFFLPKKLKNLH
ncbi:hypothetical protein FG167_17240 [Lacinutrix sp. WUR7]|uniref:hypothetical protein n=1 Tax=Lacinutrix sp. WUR7 TaxID=2653681 RepID=UPI00193E8A65|nr:hypothetical protein [Lacinutrix sp. WUR7]QRM90915.1 hypothetical protein FG167_17240 [Lacinutrix sp. WUR7]